MLRGQTIFVEEATVYTSSHWDAFSLGKISEKYITVRGVVLATRTRESKLLEAFAYISEESDAGDGVWLNDTDFAPPETY